MLINSYHRKSKFKLYNYLANYPTNSKTQIKIILYRTMSPGNLVWEQLIQVTSTNKNRRDSSLRRPCQLSSFWLPFPMVKKPSFHTLIKQNKSLQKNKTSKSLFGLKNKSSSHHRIQHPHFTLGWVSWRQKYRI